MSSHTHSSPNNFGLATICAVDLLTISPDVYSWLETYAAYWGQYRLMGLDDKLWQYHLGVGNQICQGLASV